MSRVLVLILPSTACSSADFFAWTGFFAVFKPMAADDVVTGGALGSSDVTNSAHDHDSSMSNSSAMLKPGAMR